MNNKSFYRVSSQRSESPTSPPSQVSTDRCSLAHRTTLFAKVRISPIRAKSPTTDFMFFSPFQRKKAHKRTQFNKELQHLVCNRSFNQGK